MAYTISKQHHLSYSHQLQGLPEDHPCGRVHGHNAIVEIELAGDSLDEHGFVLDYGELKPWKDMLDDMFDHQHLNNRIDFQPTAENLARYVFEWAVAKGWPVSAVGWSETPKTWAWFRP